MHKLSEIARPVPADTFAFCQLCGRTFSDICDVDLWQECDDVDQPTGPYLLLGRGCGCKKDILQPHPRLYRHVPWGRGGPGRFTLLCGSCPYRAGFECTHPNLAANGGSGLLVHFSRIFSGRVCFTDGTARGGEDFGVASACEGHPTRRQQLRAIGE